MPLEKLMRSPVVDANGAPIQSTGGGRYIDSIGVVSYDSPGYTVTQLDGYRTLRNPTVSIAFVHAPALLDVTQPSRILGVQTTTSIISSSVWNTGFMARELEPRTGQYRYRDGAVVTVFDIAPPPSQCKPLALLPDRILFAANLGTIGTNAPGRHWIVSFPRDPLAPQVWTYELAFPPDVLLGTVVGRAQEPDCIWITRIEVPQDQIGGDPEEFRAGLYNYVTKRIVRWVTLPLEGDEYPVIFDSSPDFGVLVAKSRSSSTGYGAIYVLGVESSPLAISAPERVRDGRIEVAGISQTNPAIVTVRGSLLQWLEESGATDGDRVFLSDSQHVNNYGAGTPVNHLGHSYPITILDDTRFSVPFDGTVRRSFTFSYSYALPTHTNWTGVVPEQAAFMSAPYETFAVGTQLQFTAATPSDHPILSETATVVRDEPLHSAGGSYLDLDMTGWPPLTSLTYQLTGPGGVLPLASVYASCDNSEVALVSVDLTGANPVFTVDDPSWLDTNDITGTFSVSLYQVGLSMATHYTTPAAVRVAADRFSVPLSSGAVSGTISHGTALLTPRLPPRGFEVRSRVTTDFGEPCAGRAVVWTASAGSFLKTPTLTDADGYAYAVFLPPVDANGDYTITASVETP